MEARFHFPFGMAIIELTVLFFLIVFVSASIKIWNDYCQHTRGRAAAKPA
jgi:hypothetical protein